MKGEYVKQTDQAQVKEEVGAEEAVELDACQVTGRHVTRESTRARRKPENYNPTSENHTYKCKPTSKRLFEISKGRGIQGWHKRKKILQKLPKIILSSN